MKTKKQYRIIGIYENKHIDCYEDAYSPKQAKLKAAFKYNFYGKDIKNFIKSKNIKVT